MVLLLLGINVYNDVAYQRDSNGDGMGDAWADAWGEFANLTDPLDDVDGDELSNRDEFRWQLIPVCVNVVVLNVQNCMDHERDMFTGAGGDAWNDGPEVSYWDDPTNNDPLAANPSADEMVAALTGAFFDPDRLVDTDHDDKANINDTDSDNDGELDGFEKNSLGTYPELEDSDCAASATSCTPSTDVANITSPREGNPGSGDNMNDGAERIAWQTIGQQASGDADLDGIPNILDPDSESDGLLDGDEFLVGVRPDMGDTDADGVPDGQEVAWNVDTDRDGRVNAADPDSDNDGMPDDYEVEKRFNMVDPTDARTDRDGDVLNNLGEYLATTDPDNVDTDRDNVLDGHEVNLFLTNPLFWDTDEDGMADHFEIGHRLNPNSASDAAQDLDNDAFDQQGDGVPELAWTNLHEYRHGRPSTHDESEDGPWFFSTLPREADTDADGGQDAYEVYFGSDPVSPAASNADTDQDGLNFTEEARLNTDWRNDDTDQDGLCDGGRAANCTFPGLPGGNHPGEADYGSTPWDDDFDNDLLRDGVEARRCDPGATGAPDTDADHLNCVLDPDSDGDRLSDWEEVTQHFTNPEVVDSGRYR